MNDEVATVRALLAAWLERTSLFPTKNLHVDLIVNPEAGAFRHRRRRRELIAALLKAPKQFPEPATRPNRTVKVSTWVTDYPGHERAILAHLQQADPTPPGDQRLVVIAGGDGTSRGALISAMELPRQVRSGLLFFRLPLGTGNDAAESRDWATALDALSGRGAVAVSPQALPVIEVRVQGHPLHYSFNIASVGLDAFVNHLTNRLKAWLPGNSYSLMVDLAAFFYELVVTMAPTRIVLTSRGAPVVSWNQPFLLAALGASGHRTYGAGKRVLPDNDNFCLAAKRNLFTKLSYRKPFYEGTHRGLSGITLTHGDALTLESPVKIPMQMDGEVLWLLPENCPITMNLADHGLQVLALAGVEAVL